MKNNTRVTDNAMLQIIGIFLRYLFVTLTLKFYYKVFLGLLKTGFYVFAFFTRFLVLNVFYKYMITCKIKFHVDVI